MSKHVGIISGIIALVAIGLGTFLVSPYYAAANLMQAVEQRDAQAASEYVDYPALRENVKAQMRQRIIQEMEASPNNAMIGMGMMKMMEGVIDAALETYLSPEAIEMMMAKAEIGSDINEIDYTTRYKGYDEFIIELNSKEEDKAPVNLVFERKGMLSWQLVNIEMDMTEINPMENPVDNSL